MAAWPASLHQAFLDDGNYGEVPFSPVLESPTDSGIQKTRKKFTGKFMFYQGTVWLENNTQRDTFMDFYNDEADQGTAYFDMPIPSSATAVSVRFVPGSVVIATDGGLGWHATFKLVQEPEAI